MIQPPGDAVSDLVQIPIADIQPSSDNPRRSLGDIDGLTASVESLGILQPITVVPNGDNTYTIVAGERRRAAAVAAGIENVPCLVRTLSEVERQEVMLVENLQRAELAPLEEAQAFQKLLDLGLNQKTIAERIGKSRAHVCRRLRLLKLSCETQSRVESRELPLEQALGYRPVASDELFASDESLQRTWLALRSRVLEGSDPRLMRLLRDFAMAWGRWMRVQANTRDSRSRQLERRSA